MNRAMSEKPKLAQQADKLARWFVARILVLSVFVFIGWYLVDPSCLAYFSGCSIGGNLPCGAVFGNAHCANGGDQSLGQLWLLTTRGHTLQTLAEITHVAFDKTGTLTYGKPNCLILS